MEIVCIKKLLIKIEGIPPSGHQGAAPEITLGRDVLTVLAFGSTSSSGYTIFRFDPTSSRTVASVVKNASLVARSLHTRMVRTHHAWVLFAQKFIGLA
jgi:hypothetical protein